MIKCCIRGDLEGVKREYSEDSLQLAMKIAVSRGHKEIADFFVEKSDRVINDNGSYSLLEYKNVEPTFYDVYNYLCSFDTFYVDRRDYLCYLRHMHGERKWTPDFYRITNNAMEEYKKVRRPYDVTRCFGQIPDQ